MPRDLSSLEARCVLADADLRGLRTRAGISTVTLARALGVDRFRVYDWERRRFMPGGWRLGAYARVIAGLDRHEEITWDSEGEARDAA